MLCLDITWLTGTAFLASDPSDPAPHWPPQPDRIFSALVASWGLGGEDPAERAALEWLEMQEPPSLHVPEPAHERMTVKVYVPPNDLSAPNTKKKDPAWLRKAKQGETLSQSDKKNLLRAASTALFPLRSRKERTFPAVALDPGAQIHLSVFWDAEPPAECRAALDQLALRTSYIGHSASLVRAAFRQTDDTSGDLTAAHRAPYPGRLKELEALYARHMKGDTNARPRPAVRVRRAPVEPSLLRPFTDDPAEWVVFEHAGGERPDLRAQAALAESMRLALMQAWTRANGEAAPAWISGHEADGTPARDPHIAVLPMANLGWAHSDGRLMGLAIVPPAAEAAAWKKPGPEAFARRQAIRRALTSLGEEDDEGHMILTLAPKRGRAWSWRLTPAASGLKSLDPQRYLRFAKTWASATPVLLDRHLKSSGPPERNHDAEELVRKACECTGLPEPEVVVLTKHAAIRGAPSARPATGNPHWMRWARRPSFGNRAFVHARLRFPEPVAGPILIGAGRFHGLGLFLPMQEGRT